MGFQATGQPVSRTQASDAMMSRLPRYEAKCVQHRCFQWGSVPLRSDIKGTATILSGINILIPLERQFTALQLCRWQFLYNKTLQQTYHPLLSKLSKRRQIKVIYLHFEEVRGSIEPSWWLTGSVIEVPFLSLTVEALQGKMCQNSLPPGVVGHLEPRFQGEGVVPLTIYWYHSKGNWLRYNLAADSFYIVKIAADFSSVIVEIVRKTTNFGIWSPFSGT